MNPSDLEELMAKAKQAQARMAALQRELAMRRVEGSAGGGMVTAVATGELRILKVEIEPSLDTVALPPLPAELHITPACKASFGSEAILL